MNNDTGVAECAVIARDLVKQFGSFSAVDHVSFEVKKGEIFGFLGPNGAGKSTTIRMLCGLLLPTSGSATVAGFDLETQSEEIKSSIGYMSQKFSLYEDLTVDENIAFYADIYGVPPTRFSERRAWILEMAGLADSCHRFTGEMPAGFKQRLALGCALVHEPRIIFLDEPTGGVDPLARRAMWDLIYRLADDGVTIFVTTHFMDEAEHCDRLALIYQGRSIALDTPSRVKQLAIHGNLYELTATPLMPAFEAMCGCDGVRDVALFGAGMHLICDASDVLLKIRVYLEQAGITIHRFEPIRPSLEDAFVALIEEADHISASMPIGQSPSF
ncbi:MAG: ABC transporter ATP-binding protein [Candidatus Ozemobacteraceae bacterium]